MAKLGILGIGNMGSAILRGIVKSESSFDAADITIYRRNTQKAQAIAEECGVHLAKDALALAQGCDYLLLAVKPIYCKEVLAPLYELLRGKVLISIVAGVDYDQLAQLVAPDTRIIRVMPNTPLAVGKGMSIIENGYSVTAEEYACVREMFACAGKVVDVESHAFNAATGISGCGPAFAYLFMEALADGGVRKGVPRDLAYTLAAQTLIGSGEMLLCSGMHPGALKDAVCSPGGTTIEGVYALERGGMRGAVIDAVGATCEKVQTIKK